MITHRIGDNWASDEIWNCVNVNRIILHLWRDGLKKIHGYCIVDGVRAEIGDIIVWSYPDKLEVRHIPTT